MGHLHLEEKALPRSTDSEECPYTREEISPWDVETFHRLTRVDLTPEQEERLRTPGQVIPRQADVLAIHWHPEWVSLELAQERVRATFPNQREALVIPTQHNELMALDEYAGVEVDAFSQGFNRKVQLLLHFKAEALLGAGSLASMLKHTQLYRASQFIEETRFLGGGVVIPHPEQFWPILLAGYDVDGYEVWNPQSREYTEFLISVLHRQNRRLGRKQKPLLVFMGDDTHLGEKTKEPHLQDRIKAAREVGWQPAWDDPPVRKQIMLAGMDRQRVIAEYKERLA